MVSRSVFLGYIIAHGCCVFVYICVYLCTRCTHKASGRSESIHSWTVPWTILMFCMFMCALNVGTVDASSLCTWAFVAVIMCLSLVIAAALNRCNFDRPRNKTLIEGDGIILLVLFTSLHILDDSCIDSACLRSLFSLMNSPSCSSRVSSFTRARCCGRTVH